MLVRHFVLCLCRSWIDLLRLWKVFIQYRGLHPEERELYKLKDRRILKSVRLSFAWAALKLQVDKPFLVFLGVISIGGLAIQGLLHFLKHAGLLIR